MTFLNGRGRGEKMNTVIYHKIHLREKFFLIGMPCESFWGHALHAAQSRAV